MGRGGPHSPEAPRVWSLGQQQHPWELLKNADSQAPPRPANQKVKEWGAAPGFSHTPLVMGASEHSRRAISLSLAHPICRKDRKGTLLQKMDRLLPQKSPGLRSHARFWFATWKASSAQLGFWSSWTAGLAVVFSSLQ